MSPTRSNPPSSTLREIFLRVIPALHARWERAFGRRTPSFLRPGTWIGGDRDGNPNVTAESLRLALGRASEAVLADYLEQLHRLGAELSISSELEDAGPEVQALAEAGGDQGRTRSDEPYRRAIAGLYARLAATYQALTGRPPQRPARMAAAAYAGPGEFGADLAVLARALGEDGGGPLDRLIRAVETFGFHLAALDLRQNADVHERVVAELLKVAGVEADYLALDEAGRIALLRRELGSVRLLASPFADYSDETRSELEIARAAAEAHALYGPDAITTAIISKAASVSDLLEINVILKEAGLWRADTRRGGDGRAPVRDDRGSAAGARGDARLARPARSRGGDGGARLSGSDGRLFRFQQGRRLSDLGVEPAPGEPGVGGGVRGSRRDHAALPRPRRRGRARRRIELRRDPRPAARHRPGQDPDHRAGRGDRRQIWQRARAPRSTWRR